MRRSIKYRRAAQHAVYSATNNGNIVQVGTGTQVWPRSGLPVPGRALAASFGNDPTC
jgi:hypothetical protein